jgi:hypothetical protein
MFNRVLLACLVVCALASPALAHHHRSVHVSHAGHSSHHRYAGGNHQGWGVPWCGLWMESHTGIHSPGLALARNWEHVGHAAYGPAPGVIGVMPHHVFQVVAVLGRGEVLAISGNDGHAVRTRPRSTGGVIAWRQIR